MHFMYQDRPKKRWIAEQTATEQRPFLGHLVQANCQHADFFIAQVRKGPNCQVKHRNPCDQH